MKFLNIAFASFTALFFLQSCDDKLDIIPKNQLIIEKASDYDGLFNNTRDLYYPIDPVWYASFSSAAYESSITGESYPLLKGNFLGLTNIDRTNTGSSGGDIYARCYYRIARYNLIIDNIMSSIGTDTEKKQILAKALILRAYNHFVLVNTYCKHYNPSTAKTDGGIIVCTKFDLEKIPSQSSVEDVYASIQKDINAAVENLPEKGNNPYQPGIAFGYALKAKVHLFKQEFNEAKQAALKSLSYNNKIFDYVAWDNSQKPVAPILLTNDENLLFAYGTNYLYNDQSIGSYLIDKYSKGDIRLERFFWKTQKTITPNSRTCQTYIDTVNGKLIYRDCKINVGGMRVPEVMLMLAECYIREGNFKDGINIINDIRKKRIQTKYYADLTANSKDEAFKILIDERDRELVITANNFYDIRRFEVEGIHLSVKRVLSSGEEFIVNSNSRIFTLPFSRDIISRNPHLVQNVEM